MRTMADSPAVPGIPELPHLATFVGVAERGSFTATADALEITQAAVSQRIAALERQLRTSLFDRRRGRIALTEAGERLYDYARRILDLHEQARRDLGAFHPVLSGDLPISASSVPGECLLPALLSEFRATHPQVHVRATVSDSASVIKDVEKGRATLGFIGQKVENPALETRSIGRDRLVLVVPLAHPWATRRTISLVGLAAEPLIIREPGSGSRSTLEKGLERAGASLAALNISLELGSNTAIKDAVKRGLGVAFLSKICVRRELEARELRAVGVQGLDLTRRFYVVHHRRRPLSIAAKAFVRFIESRPIDRPPPKRS
jgi:DNA-binding transcriptional LysR family regulator